MYFAFHVLSNKRCDLLTQSIWSQSTSFPWCLRCQFSFHVPIVILSLQLCKKIVLFCMAIRCPQGLASYVINAISTPKGPPVFLSSLLSVIWPEGPIIWHYIINHFILSIHVIFLIKRQEWFAIYFSCELCIDAFAMVTKVIICFQHLPKLLLSNIGVCLL